MKPSLILPPKLTINAVYIHYPFITQCSVAICSGCVAFEPSLLITEGWLPLQLQGRIIIKGQAYLLIHTYLRRASFLYCSAANCLSEYCALRNLPFNTQGIYDLSSDIYSSLIIKSYAVLLAGKGKPGRRLRRRLKFYLMMISGAKGF